LSTETSSVFEGLSARLATVTPREREVLELLVAGKSHKTIAALLGINRKTLGTHRTRIREKMGVETETALVRLMLLGSEE
jgi:DNA-binding CsgD family transcriptional regulator